MRISRIIGLLTACTVTASVAIAQPAAETPLGEVKIPRNVKADGKPLAAGTYQVRLTSQMPSPAAAGQTMERWVEFLQGGQVKGREVVSIIPAGELKDLNSANKAGIKSAPNGAKVEMLRGGEYLRVWISNAGVSYLIHLPPG
ncbi:MAG: hypothetical protein ACRD2N_19390 [Vicinamibacterales bacterium]